MTDLVPTTPQAPIPGDDTGQDGDTLDELLLTVQRLRDLSTATTDDLAAGGGPTLLPATVDASPDAAKAALARHRADAGRRQDQLRAAREAVKDWLAREMSAADAVLAPLRRRIELLEEGIWTVNLYLGADESIVTLADGDPAPAETPISVRQMVLSMDEETRIAADRGGIDYRDLDAVDRWITSDPAHLDQILPEPRGVVAFVPRRRGRDYGDLFVNKSANNENRRGYWLIRNGSRLYRMTTAFDVGERITPTRDEFDRFFTYRRYDHETGRTERIPLQPGSVEWANAQNKAEKTERDYLRAMLILQGLIDRTVVFHPLPAPSVSLLRPESHAAGHVRLIGDAEVSLTDGRRPFYEWLAERNAQLSPGMRIVGAFASDAFNSLCLEWDRYSHERLTPRKASRPASGQIHTLDERRPGGGLAFRYRRTDDVYRPGRYRGGEYGPAKTRATCVIFPTDRFVLPLDLVTVAELQDYLDARTERHAYLELVPLLTAAIDAKNAEAVAEAPFRELLAAQLAATYDLDPDQARAQVPELVDWWKFTVVHHRPLVHGDDPKTEARAVKQILAEYGARRDAENSADHDTDQAVIATLRAHAPDAILFAATRDGHYLALAPQPRRHPATIARQHVYLREYRTGKTGRTVTTREWTTVDRRRVDRWRILWSDPAWQNWNLTHEAAASPTDAEIDELITYALDAAREHRYHYRGRQHPQEPAGVPVAVTHTPNGPGRGTLTVHLDPDDHTSIPTRLLTDSMPTVDMRELRIHWRRAAGRRITRRADERADSRSWQRPAGRDGTPVPPWKDDATLWTDPDRLAALRSRAADIGRAQAAAHKLTDITSAVARTVEAGWLAAAKATAYGRFMADYADPDRWEGYWKTLNVHYPHHGHAGLRTLVHRLVEDHHDIAGHTVSTAAALLPEETHTYPPDVADLPLSPTGHRHPSDG